MIEMGLVVSAGLVLLFMRLSWRKRIWLLSHPMLLDWGVFIGLTLLHWGTFSGLMVAAVAALFCSLTISLGRKLFGYVVDDMYYPGLFNIAKELA
jgi:hypothetical protein